MNYYDRASCNKNTFHVGDIIYWYKIRLYLVTEVNREGIILFGLEEKVLYDTRTFESINPRTIEFLFHANDSNT